MTQAPPHEWLGSTQVCEILRIDRSTLSRWVDRGGLTPAAKMPGKTGAFLFDPEEVERKRCELLGPTSGQPAVVVTR